MNHSELLMFILYLVFMLGIGIWFFVRSKDAGEKDYFLGGREMGAWVSGLSAGASDMSAWVLMGMPASIYAYGMGKAWIPVGLFIGYSLSWIFIAPRLRSFSIVCGDSITIPQYLTNRFAVDSRALQLVCALIFLFAYTIYVASALVAGTSVFTTLFPDISPKIAMFAFLLIIVAYTFFGGFAAVCWTDFFQGMLILAAMLIAPIAAASVLTLSDTAVVAQQTPGFWNAFANWKDIASGLGWGLGYFGMPHIIIRFMSLKSQKDLKKSAKIGISWTVLIVIFAALIGIIGRLAFGFNEEINEGSLVFITMVRKIFPGVISGILLSAVLAASMSTADSQLLAAASSFSADVYQPVIRKNKASDKEMLWSGRIVVLVIAVCALLIASNPSSGSIMSLVSNAWGVFGAAFGPAIMLSLFWKRFNFGGAVAGIVVGAVVDICWLVFLSDIGIYEIIPGFVASMIAAVVVTLITKKPSEDIEKLYDNSVAYTE